jgi:hypothetical protein
MTELGSFCQHHYTNALYSYSAQLSPPLYDPSIWQHRQINYFTSSLSLFLSSVPVELEENAWEVKLGTHL